jgi:hypothetical protein
MWIDYPVYLFLALMVYNYSYPTSKKTPKPSWDDNIDLGSAFEDDWDDATPKKLYRFYVI